MFRSRKDIPRREFLKVSAAGVTMAALYPKSMLAVATPLVRAQAVDAKPERPSENHPVPAIQDTETVAQRNARMAWWRAARFGMFIHWGLYSVPAGNWNGKERGKNGEWIMNSASIPVADYKALAKQFDPTDFNAYDIVALAKSAGMKYIIFTAKHHDGFAMYASKVNSFNIVDATPFHRDPLRELSIECRKQDVKLGIYYSQAQDWTAPGGAVLTRADRPRPGHDPVTGRWDPKAQNGDFDVYLRTKSIPQVKELLENYHPAVVYFDTPTKMMTLERAAEFVVLLNKYPNLIWNNRLGGGYEGDTKTPEQAIQAKGYPGEDWENDMTMNDTWGYKSGDHDFKPADTLIQNLIDICSKGGNYLLNIGPDSHGIVPQPEVDRLHQMGRWLDVNGEAIYGTTASIIGPANVGSYSPTEKDRNGKPKFIPTWSWRSTTTDKKIYIEGMDWPHGTFHVDNMSRKVTGAYLLADPAHKPLKYTQTGKAFDIQLPAQALDPVATVIVLNTSL